MTQVRDPHILLSPIETATVDLGLPEPVLIEFKHLGDTNRIELSYGNLTLNFTPSRLPSLIRALEIIRDGHE